MKLHNYQDEFESLISYTAKFKNLPETAIRRDYYIVMLLKNLSESDYADSCVFKGGTSLSKCYPGSIERFSEDIDLTYLGTSEMSNKTYSKNIKSIENIMTKDAFIEKINSERFERSKSMYVWFDNVENRIKLEIGSSVRPDPYSKKLLKTYIQEFLEENDGFDDIERFELKKVPINVLNIERTFIDKIMSVKRHAICGNLNKKVRHIYDVVRLFKLPEIQKFLTNKDELKRLVKLTKETDSYYLTKRNVSKEYNPLESFNFENWKKYFNKEIKNIYENLHNELLYTSKKQSFNDALNTFENINIILKSIDE